MDINTQESTYRLAKAYMNGDGVEENEQEGVRLYRLLVENGYAPAMCSLGRCYLYGWGVDVDKAEGLQWVRKAASLGNVNAYVTLGHCYLNGDGVEQDYAQALEWYRKGAECESASAQTNIGICYLNGEGVEQDYAQAAVWFQKGAKGGDEEAQYNLAICYENGDGVEQDLTKAVCWYQKAAERGHIGAQYNLGICYLIGNGVARDDKQAVYWFQKAAESGFAGAQHNLAVLYDNGEIVEQDFEKAAYWHQKAAENGDASSQNDLGVYYYKGKGVDQDFKEAVYWFQKAAESGDAEALYNLGICCLNGRGVDQDDKQAAKYFQQAAANGDTSAMEMIVSDYDLLGYHGRYPISDITPEEQQEQYNYAESILDSAPDEAVSILTRLGHSGHLPSQNRLFGYYVFEANPSNAQLSSYWLLLAAETGDKHAMSLVATHYARGIGVPQAEAKAFQWARRYYETYPDDPDAQTKMGLFYIDGTGTERDIDRGVALVRNAAESGYAYAQDRLGMVYFYGMGVPRNPQKAIEWLKKAHAGGWETAEKDLATVYSALGIQPETAEKTQKPKKKKTGIIIVAILAIIALFLVLRSCGRLRSGSAYTEAPAQSEMYNYALEPESRYADATAEEAVGALEADARVSRTDTYYDGGQFLYRDIYAYDEQGRQLERDTYSCYPEEDDAVFAWLGSVRYEYDDQDNLIREIYYYTSIEDEMYTIHYDYDDAGHLVAMYSDYVDDPTHTEYEYNGNLLVREYHHEEYTGDSLYEYEYDDAGQMLSKSEYLEDGSLYSILHYTYSEDGLLESAVYEVIETPLPFWMTDDYYEYDSLGNLIRITSYDIDGALASETLYYYDETNSPNDRFDPSTLSDTFAEGEITEVHMTSDQQYEANIFLSNFSEQGFGDYDSCAWSLDQLVKFAYNFLHINHHNTLGYDDNCYTFSLNEANQVLERYLGLSLSEGKAQEFYIDYGDGERAYYQNGEFYFPAADGDAYNYFSVVSSMEEAPNGIVIMYFDIYELDIEEYRASGSVDSNWYHVTADEAASSSNLTWISSGEAFAQPFNYNGRQTYQLLTYKLL